MRLKMPWIDWEKCIIEEVCEECKASQHCPYDAFLVIRSDNGCGETCKAGIDFDKCKLCGECSHACELGAVKMI